jgi:hypothetical protein
MRDHLQQDQIPTVITGVSEDNSEVYAVAIRETETPGSWSLSFTACYDAGDPQEIRLGMDTYCLIADPGQATHYGGVTACETGNAQLHLTLTEEAASSLGMPADVSFALDLTPRQLSLLNRGLARVLTSGRTDAIPQRLNL